MIHLSFTDVITGFAGEKKPLPFNVNSKNGFDHVKSLAPQVVAAVGQIIDEKNGKYSIIKPDYKFEVNKDDSNNKCKANLDIFRNPRHFMIQPITKLDIGSKKLLTPLRINHTVEHVKNSADNVDFQNYFEFTTSGRYKFNSIERKYSVLSNCLRSEYGTGNLKTHLKFGDKSATVNEIEFYWEGGNRYPHKPSI
ncbi:MULTISPECIES: hypothetical protein [Providencia]|nr:MULTISPECIES: hypothetical protein [Providencia]EJD6082600.1 hypothetical protein [Providencia rettgeri]EJD6601343.1 hypothetical protein [Providencia rettgeri]MBQ0329160.1 hypothetical protein [Providencia rettgeri]QQE93465.1 hypothetical protein JFB93_00925 [Providencia rettgeri]QWJ91929.1 hypothetical protein KM147_00955 [Providencia rettgeri]